MTLSCNTYGVVDPKRPGQGIGDILNSDFQSITLDLRGYLDEVVLKILNKRKKLSGPELDVKAIVDEPEVLMERINDVMQKLKGKDLNIDAVIAPTLPPDDSRPDLKDFEVSMAKKSIDIARMTGSQYVVVPPVSVRNSNDEEKSENRKFYLGIAEYLKSKGEKELKILLVNRSICFNGHYIRGTFTDPAEAVKWIDSLNEASGDDLFAFCLDVGTCNVCGQYTDEVINHLGKHIKMVLLCDNDGDENLMCMPLSYMSGRGLAGDWSGTISGLREIGFDGIMTMELRDTVSAYSVMLRPEIMNLAYKVGEFIRWQIEIERNLKKYKNIVLFGAGNMCLNYMKNYGEKYPPLFTCDNNSALWNTEFGGLKVQNPETLKELPEDTAVFICNLYYREIEQQLKVMGVQNIEFFSDEFLNNINMNRVVR